jgi:hypothetical protein
MFTDVSEVLVASMFRVMRALVEAASTSETSVNFYHTHYTAQHPVRQSFLFYTCAVKT